MITQNEKPPHGRPFLFSITRRILEKIIFQNLIDVNDNLGKQIETYIAIGLINLIFLMKMVLLILIVMVLLNGTHI